MAFLIEPKVVFYATKGHLHYHPINLIKQSLAFKSNMNLIYNSENNHWNNFTLKI